MTLGLEKEEKPVQDNKNLAAITAHVRERYPAPDNTEIDVRYLWDNFYRVNYRRKLSSPNSIVSESYIVHSVFMRVTNTSDGLMSEAIKDGDKGQM